MISSASNPQYRRWLAAREGPERKQGEILLEGLHLIQAWQARYGAPVALILSSRFKPSVEWINWHERHGGTPEILSEVLFNKLCSLENFAGPIALVNTQQALGRAPSSALGDLVYLDRIQDPGNLGTILRCCAALGVKQVALSPGTVWLWHPKVLRAGMSAHFALEFFEEYSFESMLALEGFQMIVTSGVADPSAQSLTKLNLTQPNLWCFGNEGSGLTPQILAAKGAQRSYIPQESSVESLNVGAAVGICLYEQYRQRQP